MAPWLIQTSNASPFIYFYNIYKYFGLVVNLIEAHHCLLWKAPSSLGPGASKQTKERLKICKQNLTFVQIENAKHLSPSVSACAFPYPGNRSNIRERLIW